MAIYGMTISVVHALLVGVAPVNLSVSDGDKPVESIKAGDKALPDGAILRLGATTWRVAEPVRCLATTPDGKYLIAAYRKITVWSVATGKPEREFGEHPEGVACISLAPDGKLLASAAYDGSIRLWDLPSGAKRKPLVGAEKRVSAIAFSPDGKQLAAGGRNSEVVIWDVASARVIREFRGHPDWVHTVAFSPDGRRLYSAGWDNVAHLWDVATGNELRKKKGIDGNIQSAAFSPDGRTIAIESQERDPPRIILWDIATDTQIRQLDGFAELRCQMAFSPDGRWLTSGAASTENATHVWDTSTGQRAFRLDGPSSQVRAVCFSHDRRTLFTGAANGIIQRWDMKTGREIGGDGHKDLITHVEFASDQRTITTMSVDGDVLRWSRDSGAVLQRRRLQSNPATYRLSPNGKYVAYRAWRGPVHIWDVDTAKTIRSFGGDSESAVYYNSRRTIGNDGNSRGKRLGLFYGFSRCDNHFFRVDLRGQFEVWDIPGNKLVQVHPVTAGRQIGDRYEQAQVSSECNRLVVERQNPNDDADILVGDLAANSSLHKLDIAPSRWGYNGIDLSPDGRTVVCIDCPRDTGYVCELRTGQVRTIYREVLVGVRLMAQSRDGLLFASYGRGSSVYVSSLLSGRILGSFKVSKGSQVGCHFSPDSKTIATVVDDHTVLLWDLTSVRKAAHEEAARLPAFSVEQHWENLASVNAEKAYRSMHKLRANQSEAMELFNKRLVAVKPPDQPEIRRAIDELSNNNGVLRENANKRLVQWAELAAPQLQEAFRTAKDTEFRDRLKRLLDRIHEPTPEQLQLMRANEVLEWLAKAAAVQLLKRMAGGDPASRVTRDAKESLCGVGHASLLPEVEKEKPAK